MKRLMFISMCFSFIIILGCEKETTKSSSTDFIAAKLVNDPNYIDFQGLNTDIFGKFIQKNRAYSAEKMSERFLQHNDFKDLQSLSTFVKNKYKSFFDKIFENVPELINLKEEQFLEVLEKARIIYKDNLKQREVDPCIDCLWEAWEAYDEHTDYCVLVYQQTGSWGDCLDSALQNFIFDSDACPC